VVRWGGELVRPHNALFEYHSLIEIENWLFRKYLSEVSSIYEFGCGTGHNLLRARHANSNASLWGLDWTGTSWEIIREMVKAGFLHAARGARFDFFNPDAERTLDKNSGVYTVAAMEQVGTRFVPFVEYLIAQRPVVCVHIEPIAELLDESVLLDRLTLAYMKKRNYLSGFLTYLREQEKKGRVVLHWAQRTHIGGLFTESNSVVVWSPK
jgi:SAM-dependent methyltransferase